MQATAYSRALSDTLSGRGAMRRLTLCLSVLMLLICLGCSRQASSSIEELPARNPKVEIKIESERTTFITGENITVMITIKNLTSQELAAPETYWLASVLLDGNEFKRLPEYIGSWNGPGVILPNGGYFYTGLTLSEYGIGQDVLTPGEHELAVKIEDDVSNVLTITIEENR